jgi:hypothetical protein
MEFPCRDLNEKIFDLENIKKMLNDLKNEK